MSAQFFLALSNGPQAPMPEVAWSTYFAGASAGDLITLPVGQPILFDVADSITYGLIIIPDGAVLKFHRTMDTRLNCQGVVCYGTWDQGTLGSPVQARSTLNCTGLQSQELAANRADGRRANSSANRGFMAMAGSRVWVHDGGVRNVPFMKLNANMNAGATSCTLEAPITAKAGDTVFLGSTTDWMSGQTFGSTEVIWDAYSHSQWGEEFTSGNLSAYSTVTGTATPFTVAASAKYDNAITIGPQNAAAEALIQRSAPGNTPFVGLSFKARLMVLNAGESGFISLAAAGGGLLQIAMAAASSADATRRPVARWRNSTGSAYTTTYIGSSQLVVGSWYEFRLQAPGSGRGGQTGGGSLQLTVTRLDYASPTTDTALDRTTTAIGTYAGASNAVATLLQFGAPGGSVLTSSVQIAEFEVLFPREYWPARPAGYGSEYLTLAADVTNGTTLTFTTGAAFAHWGAKQYLVPTANEDDPAAPNLSLTPRTILDADEFGRNGVSVLGSVVKAAIAARVAFGYSAADAGMVDERATAAVLNRGVVWTCPNDADAAAGYRFTFMKQGLSGQVLVNGLHIPLGGKAGMRGNYPFHMHMLSYDIATGALLGDCTHSNYTLSRISVNDSSNRGIVVHGTNGLLMEKCVGLNADGMVWFLEDGSERRNTFRDSYFANAMLPRFGQLPIKRFDTITRGGWDYGMGSQGGHFGPNAVWYTSPDNTVQRMRASGGYVPWHNSFSPVTRGASALVTAATGYVPSATVPLLFNDVECSCGVFKGFATNPIVIDERGSMNPSAGPGAGLYGYNVAIDVPNPAVERFTKVQIWAPGDFAYFNEVENAEYEGLTISGIRRASNETGDRPPATAAAVFGRLRGSASGGPHSFFRGLLYPTHTLRSEFKTHRPVQRVSYHIAANDVNTILIPAALGSTMWNEWGGANGAHQYIRQTGGGTAGHDMYVDSPMEELWARSSGNAILGPNCSMMMRFPSAMQLQDATFGAPYIAKLTGDGGTSINPTVTQYTSMAWRLPADGHLFGSAGGWWVGKRDFYLHDTTGGVDAPAPTGLTGLNGVLLSSSYDFYGITWNTVNGSEVGGIGDWSTSKAIAWKRLNKSTLAVVDTIQFANTTSTGTTSFKNMKRVEVLHGGAYDASWSRSDVPLPTSLRGSVFSMRRTDAIFYVAVDWDPAATVTTARLILTNGAQTANFTQTNISVADLLSRTNGCFYYKDAANSKLWLAIHHGGITGWPDVYGQKSNKWLIKQTTIEINLP